jgi:excisionase family DNA binding protein
MNALQQWYDYVDSVSRPANPEDAVPEVPDAAGPRPGAPAGASLPDNTIDLGPRFRARSYLSALIAPVEPVPAEWWVVGAGPEPDLPELRFEPVAVALPRFRDYVAASPRDEVPWDGDAKAWVAAVAAAVARAERARQPAPPPASPAAAPEWPGPSAPVELASSPVAAPVPESAPAPASASPPAVAAAPPPSAAAPAAGSVDVLQLQNLKARVQSRDSLRDLPSTAEIAQHSYKQPFRESRDALVQRLLDPPLTLEETARLLGVCPTTVRRYTNRGALKHFRTGGNQRRFRLSDVLAFMEASAAGEEQEDPACEPFTG